MTRVSAATPAVLAAASKPADRGICAALVFSSRWISIRSAGIAAERAVRDDRIVQEGDAGDVRAECRGDRDRVVGREVLRYPARQIDDDVLDHGATSRSTVHSAAGLADTSSGRGKIVPPGIMAPALQCGAGTAPHFCLPSGPNGLR